MRVLALILALSSAASALNVRVLVASGADLSVSVPISSSLAYAGAAQPDGTQPAVGAQPSSGNVQWSVRGGGPGGHLTLNGQDAGSANLYLPPAAGSTVTIGGQVYRGGVSLRAVGGSVQAINVVDLEDYVRSVVAGEMPSSWAPEALRAQAVIARTYAVLHLNPAGAFDLCADERCQVYGGVRREAPGTDAATLATRAQVVSYGGRAAKTYFSSDSGGFTASSQEVWGEALPYLLAQPDPASRSPRSQWTLSLPYAKVQEVAASYRVRLGALRSVAVTRASPSGRPQEISFVGAGGTARLAGAEAGGFVRALGAYSTRVTLASDGRQLTLQGAGNGHGVGLSQYGAANLAAQRWNFLQILGFYYPGASISALVEQAGAGAAARLTEAGTRLNTDSVQPDHPTDLNALNPLTLFTW